MVARVARTAATAVLLLLCLGTAMSPASLPGATTSPASPPAATVSPSRSSGAAGSAARGPSLRVPRVITNTAAMARTLAGYLSDAGGASSGLVVDQNTGQTLFAEDATTPRLPASVEKLFTTSSALFDFGYDYRFQTDVYGVGTLADGVFSGKLYLKGGGDPTFGDQGFDAANWHTGATLQTLLKTLRADGVHRIRGTIIGDASVFDNRGGGPDTGYRANLETEGELSGLAYDAGFTSGAETRLQPDPALWAAQALGSVAPSEGITIAPGTRISTGTTPASAKLLARDYSPTLATLLKLTNAPSDNFFAETLDKDLGWKFGARGSTSAGAAVVRQVVAVKLGLSERTDDGSGLSDYDRTTATEVVELLQEMEPSSAFYDSLAVAGVSGTMIDEMLNTPAAGNCRGKTGTLHNVANLVGYCTAANGQRLIFAFIENGLTDSTYGHETEDLMGETLAAYDGQGKGSPAPVLPDPNAGADVPSRVSVPSGSSDGTTTTKTPTTTTPTTPSTTTTPAAGGSGL
jgi:D-alanyl-D-alanine carboxypeptidase/D-alanyl-D-alanine-endopeptidase (penicillin-binding protein 4)